MNILYCLACEYFVKSISFLKNRIRTKLKNGIFLELQIESDVLILGIKLNR